MNVRTLRAQLAQALRRAEGGERIVVTVGGRPVAQLGPVESDLDRSPTIEDLVARGLLIRARRDDRPEPSLVVPLWAGARLDRLLREIR
ncbi:MAG: type II toxin-antitoxin system prevent-host-death family antitoxin [Actinomycetota bacterium]|nr:type II toxin-antitoxin system prevent-host-death family antitoxin [Acidimicrobiia bacterium]MDQ3293780.1 type II toxin-antitoxin system prevent-host-death family antitoxin [Actinomycetota bacterium]